MRLFRFGLLALCLALTVRATTVVPPRFDELVGQSELIFRGQVTAIEAIWRGDGPHRHIATRVTFAVERVLRGSAGESVTLEFAGGELDGKSLMLAGWPQFAPGDRGLFFVENRAGRLCPLVRLRHGRYRVVPDASGGEMIVRDDHTPLLTLDAVSLPLSESARLARPPVGAGLSRGEFENAIAARSAELPPAAQPR